MPKKILIFSVAYRPFIGGAEIAVEEITKRLTTKGFSFDLLTVNLDGKQKSEEIIGGVRIFRLGKETLGKFLFPFTAFFSARKLHRQNYYNATWAIMANYAGFAALFFKIFHPTVPFILTLQEGDPIPEIKRKVRFAWPIFKMIFHRADQITAISNYLAKWGKEMGAKNVVVIPNGVDLSKFQKRGELGLKKDDVILITTGRLVKKNGVGDIISALKFLPENVKLLIVGIGSLEENLKRKAKSEKLEGRIKFAGFVVPEKIPEYLWSGDIFIRPSLSEGMGNSFIEAMAAGLPIIGTPVGGIPDFLFPPESSKLNLESEQRFNLCPTGLFCKTNNPKSIAKKVKLLLADNSLRQKIIANSQKLVAEKYDWNLIAEKMSQTLTQN